MTNYSRGRAREYKTMQLLRRRGYVCSRSAMSHGPVDIFAAKAGKILLIQVKSGSARVKKDELRLLRKWAAAFDAEAQIWSFKKRGRLLKVTVRAKVPGRDRSRLERRASTLGFGKEKVDVSPITSEGTEMRESTISEATECPVSVTISSRPSEDGAPQIPPLSGA